MESKIAERINNDITSSPFTIYRMIPAYYGADIIGVSTIQKFAEVIALYDNVDDYQEFLDSQPDKSKIMIMPGLELPIGVAIAKHMGTVLESSIEEELVKEGYLIID